MSKQAIQAAKQRKRWLLLPAFLAMAVVVLGGNWLASGDAKANVNAGDYVMTGPEASNCTSAAPNPVPGGSTLCWTLTGTLTANVAGALTVVVDVDTTLMITDWNPGSGPQPDCDIDDDAAGNTLTCTYPANMNLGTVFTLEVLTEVNEDGVDIPAGAVDVTADDASAQAAQAGTSAPSGVIYVTPAANQFSLVKSNSQCEDGLVDTSTNGSSCGSFTITFTNNSAETVVVSITDTLDADLNAYNSSYCSITQGANDYLTYPCGGSVGPGGTFTVYIYYEVINWDPYSCGLGTLGTIGTNLAEMNVWASDPGTTQVVSSGDSNTETVYGACFGQGTPDLYHLDPFGDPDYDQDVNNNLIGWVHQVCAENMIVDGVWPDAGDSTITDTTSGQPIEATLMFKVVDANSVGNPNTIGIQATPLVDCDGDGEDDDSLLSWYSTEPGDQFITVVDDGGSFVWGYNDDESIDPLIKEWNTLVPTLILAGTAEGTADLDGTTINSSVFWAQSWGEFLSYAAKTVYEHVHGTHRERNGSTFTGDVIGAEVTFTVSGTCGEAAIGGAGQGLVDDGGWVDMGGAITLGVGESVTLISVGVPIKISIEADGCLLGNGDYTTVTIETDYYGPLGSTQPGGDTETITVKYTLAPPTNKQPLLAWAGQRVVLEHNWVEPDGFCPWNNFYGEIPLSESFLTGFFVRYVKQNGPGSFVGGLGTGLNIPIVGILPSAWTTILLNGGVVNTTADSADVFAFDPSIFVPADLEDFYTQEGFSNVLANADCVTRALYESQDEGEVDISSFVVIPQQETIEDFILGNFDFTNASPQSQQVPFLIYYMQFEGVTLGRVAGAFDGHSNGNDALGRFSNTNPWDTATDTTSGSSNVSADVLLRARVKGWFTTSVPTGRAAVPNVAPAGRWVMPDDWELLAGGALAETYRPNYDIMFAPDSGYSCSKADGADLDSNRDVDPENCTSAMGQGAVGAAASAASIAGGGTGAVNHAHVQGPFSLLDTPGAALGPAGAVVGSLAPYNPEVIGHVYQFRNTILPDGDVDQWDAPMPPALIYFNLTGSGFLTEAPKANVYSTGTNAFYVANIPAEPWIKMLNSDGEGYRTNSWAAGAPYRFWDPVAMGSAVYSAAGKDTSKTTASAAKAVTGGWTSIAVYSDNHGEAMAIVNGDAGLTMEACDTANNAAQGIVSISGYYCENGDKVGASTVSVVADYPDKRKFAPIASNSVTVDWTWGGIKRVDVVPGEDEQFSYVVFTVTDRDGFCAPSPSLHPVNGEVVDFIIDAGDGIIVARSDGRPALGALEASVPVFDNDVTGAPKKSPVAGCEAWIKVSNSLLGQLNVLIVAHDPEGTITFDRIVDFTSTASYTLKFRWSLVTWTGANNIPVSDALSGTGANAGGTNVKDRVTAVYGWNQAAQEWMAWFPNTGVPGAVDLQTLVNGAAYWVAITAGADVTWTWKTNVN